MIWGLFHYRKDMKKIFWEEILNEDTVEDFTEE
jgi:hypothetical protein